jgi:hypothetical protein
LSRVSTMIFLIGGSSTWSWARTIPDRWAPAAAPQGQREGRCRAIGVRTGLARNAATAFAALLRGVSATFAFCALDSGSDEFVVRRLANKGPRAPRRSPKMSCSARELVDWSSTAIGGTSHLNGSAFGQSFLAFAVTTFADETQKRLTWVS